MGVADHDEERLGPGDGHVEPLGVGEEAQPVLVVQRDILGTGPEKTEKRISIIEQSEDSMSIIDQSEKGY